MEQLKSVTCEPTCGFTVKSHNENEIVNFVKTHAKNEHGKEMGENEVKKMIKTEQPAMINR